jgi:hypothetical protein
MKMNKKLVALLIPLLLFSFSDITVSAHGSGNVGTRTASVTPQVGDDILVTFADTEWVISWLSDTSDQRLEVTDFRIVFTPCVTSTGISYKISATNPGGFYYNIWYHTKEDPTTIYYTLAEDFATKGSMPVHAYIWNDLDNDGKIDYWIELTDVTNKITTTQEPGLPGGTITVSGVPVCNNVLITIHITFTLKGTSGYSFDNAKDFEGTTYTFSASDGFSTEATLTAHARVES